MPKHLDTCTVCYGKKMIPVDARGKDWVECPVCEGFGNHECWTQKVTPPLIFNGMGMPDNIRNK